MANITLNFFRDWADTRGNGLGEQEAQRALRYWQVAAECVRREERLVEGCTVFRGGRSRLRPVFRWKMPPMTAV